MLFAKSFILFDEVDNFSSEKAYPHCFPFFFIFANDVTLLPFCFHDVFVGLLQFFSYFLSSALCSSISSFCHMCLVS